MSIGRIPSVGIDAVPETQLVEVVLKGRITQDHRVEADVPKDWAQGTVEVVVRRPSEPSLERLKETLSRIASRPRKGRTREEIDTQIREEREAWVRRTDWQRE